MFHILLPERPERPQIVKQSTILRNSWSSSPPESAPPEEWRLFHRGGRSLEPGPGEASEWNRSWRGGRLHATLRRPHVVTSLHVILKHSCGKYTLLGTNIFGFSCMHLAPHFWNTLRGTNIYLTLGEGTSSSNISNIPWVGMRMKQAPDKPEVWRPFSCLPGYLQETGGKVMEGDVKKFQCRQLLLCLFYTPLYTIINPLIMVYTYHEWFIRVVLCVIYIYIMYRYIEYLCTT